MPGLEIPPWIQPADPAAHMARGLQIGVQIGSEQAADRFRQMQMARDQEEFAQKQALAENAFQLERQQRQEEAKQAAMKMQAQLQYQQAVQEGMDPLKALVQFGVAAGQNVGPVATAMRTMQMADRQANKAETPVPDPEVRFANLDDGTKVPYLVDKKTGRGTWMPSGFEKKTTTKTPQPGALTQADRDELHDLEREQDKLTAADEKDTAGAMALNSDPKTMSSFAKAALKKYKDRHTRIDEIQKRVDEIRAGSRGQTGAAPPPGSTTQYYFDPVQKRIVLRTSPAAQSADASD